MTSFRFSLFLIFTSTIVFGQQNLVTGKVKLVDGNEVRGLIDYRNWAKNPTKIHFKSDGGEEKTLSFDELVFFEVTRPDNVVERYQKAVLEVDKSPHLMDELDSNLSPRFELDTVFLLELYRGAVDLFYLKDWQGKIHFFYSKSNDSGIKELVQKRYRKEGSTALFYSNQYISQLNSLTVGCSPTAQIVSESVKYEVRSMIAAVKAVNDCLGSKPSYVFTQESANKSFYINAGLSLTQLRFDRYYGSDEKLDLERSVGAVLGLGLDYYISRTNERLAFSNELFFTHFHAKKELVDDSAPNDPVYDRVSIKMAYLRLNTMIKWRFYKWKNKPFLFTGFSNGVALVIEQSGEIERNVFGEPKFFPYKPLDSVRKYEQGLLMGFGTSFLRDKMSISARFSVSNGMSANKAYRTLIRSSFVLVAYSF
jgi:Outer membrane protein beta-barrel domain